MRWNADYRTANDTGEQDATAIAPYTNGEPVNLTIMRRPPENLRVRTEQTRQYVQDQRIITDLDRNTLLWGGGDLSFDGAAPAYSGKFTITQNLNVGSAATAGDATLAPYIASTPAQLLIGTLNNNQILFVSQKNMCQGADPALARVNDISVEIVSGSALAVTVTGSAGILNNIHITITGSTTCTEVINAVNGHATAFTLVVASLAVGSTGTNLAPLWGETEWVGDFSLRFLKGGSPGVVHEISPVNLAAFFDVLEGTDYVNALQPGDTLAIWYDKIYDGAGVDGRLQATADNGKTAIPSASLFNTRREPEKIPGCLPVCKCIDNANLLFLDGTLLLQGAIAKLGAGEDTRLRTPLNWVRIDEGTHDPPVTIRHALDNIDKNIEDALTEIETARSSSIFGAKASLDARIEAIDTHVRAVFTCTDGTITTGGMFNGLDAIQQAIQAAAVAPQGATILIRTGMYNIDTALTITYPICLIAADATVVVYNNVSTGYMFTFGVNSKNSVIDSIVFQKGGSGTYQLLDLAGNGIHIRNVKSTQGSIRVSADRVTLERVDASVDAAATHSLLDLNGGSFFAAKQCVFDFASTAVPGVIINAGTHILFDHCKFISANAVTAMYCNEVAPIVQYVTLKECHVDCRPFTADKHVFYFNLMAGLSIDGLSFEVSLSTPIRTSFLWVAGHGFRINNVRCVLTVGVTGNLLNFGADNNPFVFLAYSNSTVSNFEWIGGRLPCTGVDGFTLSSDEPVIRLAGCYYDIPTTITLEHANIRKLITSNSPSGDLVFNILGDRDTVTGAFNDGSGYQHFRDVHVDLTSVMYSSVSNQGTLFRAIQTGSIFDGCRLVWGALLGGIYTHTVQVIPKDILINNCVFESQTAQGGRYGIVGTTPFRITGSFFYLMGMYAPLLSPYSAFVLLQAHRNTFSNNRIIQAALSAPDTTCNLLAVNGSYNTLFGNIFERGHASYIAYSEISGTGNLPAVGSFATYNAISV